jgi:hypothetical protein
MRIRESVILPVRIAERNEPKLRARVNNKIFSHLAEMYTCQARPHEEFSDEVTVADAIHRVLGQAHKAELLLEEGAINGERVARHRA